MTKIRIWAITLLIFGALLGYGLYKTETAQVGFFSNWPFRYGLDLNGGVRLVYQADVSKIPLNEVPTAMESLVNTIEHRINTMGLSETSVQSQQIGDTYRLVVEIPGVDSVEEAIKIIGGTPNLEFRLQDSVYYNEFVQSGNTEAEVDLDRLFIYTGLTGQYLNRASIQPDQLNRIAIGLQFDDQGKELFASITKNNIGAQLAVFLDGEVITSPVINTAITNGEAVITGRFTRQEAQELVRNLNSGALPVPLSAPISTELIGASLGEGMLHAGVTAGIWSFILISIFLIAWYRLPGLIASLALALYIVFNLTVFKLIGVTITSAGIAGLILSIGMAVDANILIFERTKEELKKGSKLDEAVKNGFSRAWTSIRDSNLSSIITSVILYYFSSNNVVRGFALVFLIGVLISMITAVAVSRTFLMSLGLKDTALSRFLFSAGFNSGKVINNSK